MTQPKIPSLAEMFGAYIEPSRLTEEQKKRLATDEYYIEAAREIGRAGGDNRVLIVAPPLFPHGR